MEPTPAQERRKILKESEYRIQRSVGTSGAEAISYSVIEAASAYWDYDGANPYDFCLQSRVFDALFDADGGIVFGGLNRLVWSPRTGFRPDRSDCSERFLANADRLGPLPGRPVR